MISVQKYLCMVMEYVEGGDVATLLKGIGGPLPFEAGLRARVPRDRIRCVWLGHDQRVLLPAEVDALIATIAWCVVVWMMHAGMKRSFMMTVRRLAGVN